MVNFLYVAISLFVFSANMSFAGMHDPWGSILQSYVLDGKVNYSGLKKSTEDMKTLDGYIKTLGKADISKFDRNRKLAFWINAYNVFTVKLILNHLPTKSIKDIKNPWKDKAWTGAGEKLSLDDIEHKKLRGELKEPRIHFAIVCASIGCPDLDSEAFTAETVDAHLKERSTFFFTLKKNFYLEEKKEAVTIYLSSIMKWFSDDFGKNEKERIAFILDYLDTATAGKIKNAAKTKVRYINYDWSLNGN